jgi:hypothetical protein
LDTRDIAFIARAGSFAVALPPLLRLVSIPRLARWMAGRPLQADGIPTPARMVRLTDRVLSYGRGPFAPNCAVRSLILFRYLRRRGEAATVCFGVRRSDEGLDGHAWVCIDEHPWAEMRDPRSRYRLTFRFPEAV